MVALLHLVLVDYMHSFLCRSSHRICNATFGNLRQAKRHLVHTARQRCTCCLMTAMRTYLKQVKTRSAIPQVSDHCAAEDKHVASGMHNNAVDLHAAHAH